MSVGVQSPGAVGFQPLAPRYRPPNMTHIRFMADGARALWGDDSVTLGASSPPAFLPGILLITEFQQLGLSGKASTAGLCNDETSA